MEAYDTYCYKAIHQKIVRQTMNTSMNNSASVIITFYNKGKLLINAIESVIHQTGLEDEILVINDCSNDTSSLLVLQTAQITYPQIRFLETPKNSGASYAKDFGIQRAINDLIILLDADDTLPDNAVNKIKHKFESDPSLALVYGNYIRHDIDLNTSKEIKCDVCTDADGLINPKPLIYKWLLLGTSPFKKSAYLETGGFDKLYPKTDDIDFLRRLILTHHKCGYLNETIYVWNRDSDGNNSGHSRKEHLFSWMRNFEFYYTFLPTMEFIYFMTKKFILIIMMKIKIIKQPS